MFGTSISVKFRFDYERSLADGNRSETVNNGTV